LADVQKLSWISVKALVTNGLTASTVGIANGGCAARMITAGPATASGGSSMVCDYEIKSTRICEEAGPIVAAVWS